MNEEILIVYVTCPQAGTGEGIARALIAEREAACVNIVPGLRSVYRWQGAVAVDDEVLLLIKTTGARFDAVCERVLALHPDELPEIVAVPVTAGLPAYLDWVSKETVVP
ncbi:MAG: divalent-cation tolerance protein CutA [Salinisphaera sp.]|nr:divalent-cation tolerance protein CutA [Salinisphaera sp.]MDN5938141.1 divalent-cation tolerance protein CutA [Salinisphaera sp.]